MKIQASIKELEAMLAKQLGQDSVELTISDMVAVEAPIEPVINQQEPVIQSSNQEVISEQSSSKDEWYASIEPAVLIPVEGTVSEEEDTLEDKQSMVELVQEDDSDCPWADSKPVVITPINTLVSYKEEPVETIQVDKQKVEETQESNSEYEADMVDMLTKFFKGDMKTKLELGAGSKKYLTNTVWYKEKRQEALDKGATVLTLPSFDQYVEMYLKEVMNN